MKCRWILLIAVLTLMGCHHKSVCRRCGCAGEGGRGRGDINSDPIVHNLPPAEMLAHPGPGVDGPGPGVFLPGPLPPPPPITSQIAFRRPEGMQVNWDVTAPGQFDSEPLYVPGRQNFIQGAIYRLRLTSIAGYEGMELFPTLEIGPTLPRTEAYLAHNPIPVEFTPDDFEQVKAGNFVTKVIYLPDAEYQQLAVAGVETLVSTRLDPGVDPIVEADRQGSIMAIVRLGDIDLRAGGGAGVPGGVQAASYNAGAAGPGGGPFMSHAAGNGFAGASPWGGAGGMPPGYVAGVTAPDYGMPYVGTPIGIVGPPHIPLGGPAGLQAHVMHNHTRVTMPPPTKRMTIHARQTPGFSYPQPVRKIRIHEHVQRDGDIDPEANGHGGYAAEEGHAAGEAGQPAGEVEHSARGARGPRR